MKRQKAPFPLSNFGSLPSPKRKLGINEKLLYCQSQYMTLMKEIIASYRGQIDSPRYLGQIAETILSGTRECFDHLGMDIIEGHVLPGADEKLRRAFRLGRLKTYFPFFRSQLEQPKFPFHRLKQIRRSLYDELELLIEATEQNFAIEGLSGDGLKTLLVVRKMVNEKKHSHVLRYEGQSQQKYFFERARDGLVCVLTSDVRGTLGHRIEGLDEATLKSVPGYRFSNGQDVWHLCGFCVGATTWIMNRFYDRHFQSSPRIELQDITPSLQVLPPSPILGVHGVPVDPRPTLVITKPTPKK